MENGCAPTFGFYYNLNIGPSILCPFCNLDNETDNHVLWKCIKTKELWSLVASITRIILNHEESFPDGACLIKNWKIWMGNKVFKALLAACASVIWKARCNLVFKKVQLDSMIFFNRIRG